jgi:hypothetical protein
MLKMSLPILTLALLAAVAVPADAAIAVRFIGTADGNDFSALSLSQMEEIEHFFEAPNLAKDRTLGDFACFVLPLEDLQSNATIGVGADCLAITPSGDGAEIDAVTFFFFPAGTIVADGMTSVRPFFEDIGDGDGAVTHITGSFPADTGPGGIVHGTGEFEGAKGGRARLSGAVNLGLESGVYFSCLFVLDPTGVPASLTGKAHGRPFD